MTQAQYVALMLVRKAINTISGITIPAGLNWTDVIDILINQGISGLCFDVIEDIPRDRRPMRKELMRWHGYTTMIEHNYHVHKQTISKIVELFANTDINVNLIKGYGLSLNWPVPEHRPCCDIDIFPVFSGKTHICYNEMHNRVDCAWRLVNKLIEKSGKKVIYNNPHHSQFWIDGILIENHKTLMDVKKIASNKIYEDFLESLIAEDTNTKIVSIGDSNFTILTKELAIMHLLRHTIGDFSTIGMTLRQLVDWAMSVRTYGYSINWLFVYKIAERFNMHIFLSSINGICVRYLGMNDNMFPIRYPNVQLENRIINDILNPEFHDKIPQVNNKFKYAIVKIKRTFINRWKYKISYNDSFCKILWTTSWNRIRRFGS